jgi:hypothetical protein
MARWGSELFENKPFSYIWDEYTTLLAFGTPEDEAYELAKNYFLPMLAKDGVTCAFWLTLAVVQQRYGILMQEVKDNALYCINNSVDELKNLSVCIGNGEVGITEKLRATYEPDDEIRNLLFASPDCLGGEIANLFYWRREIDRKGKEKILDKLKEKLLSPPKPRKKVSKPSWWRFARPVWKMGELLLAQVGGQGDEDKWWFNKYMLYRVAHIDRQSASKIKPDLSYQEYPSGALYNWIGDEIPSPEIVKDLDFFKFACPVDYPYGIQLLSITPNPNIQKLTILQKKCDYPMPPENELAKPCRVHIGHILCFEENDKHFKTLYEHFKRKGG